MNHHHQLLFLTTAEQCDLDCVTQKANSTPSTPEPNPKPRSHHLLGLLLIVGLIVAFLINESTTFETAAIENEDGTYALSPARQAKLDQELERLENAEQYALIARVNGWYTCYTCIGTDSIYLYIGEVWKYGMTRLGQFGRYRDGLPDRRLVYNNQFQGNVYACLAEEKRKIYNYVLLAENLKRTNRLIRPPGNKQDN